MGVLHVTSHARLEDDTNRSIMPLAAALTLVALACAVTFGPGGAVKPALAQPPGPSLDGLSNQGLILAFDQAGGSASDRGMEIAQRLWERRDAIERRDLISVLADRSRPGDTRELMVDLLAGGPDGPQVTDDVRDLLGGDSLDSELKARVVAFFEFARTDSSLLSSLASGSEELVAFHAMKKLAQVAPETARRLARETLSRGADASDSRLSAAYKVLVRSGTLETDHATREAFAPPPRVSTRWRGFEPRAA